MDKEKLKKKYGFARKTVILYYGAMRDDKGTWDLYQSMYKVLESNPKVIYLYICRERFYLLTYSLVWVEDPIKIHKEEVCDYHENQDDPGKPFAEVFIHLYLLFRLPYID